MFTKRLETLTLDEEVLNEKVSCSATDFHTLTKTKLGSVEVFTKHG